MRIVISSCFLLEDRVESLEAIQVRTVQDLLIVCHPSGENIVLAFVWCSIKTTYLTSQGITLQCWILLFKTRQTATERFNIHFLEVRSWWGSRWETRNPWWRPHGRSAFRFLLLMSGLLRSERPIALLCWRLSLFDLQLDKWTAIWYSCIIIKNENCLIYSTSGHARCRSMCFLIKTDLEK